MPMFAIEPVTLTIRLTVAKATEGGLLGGISDVEVLTANGEVDARFYGFADYRGAMVLNFKADGRQAKVSRKVEKKLNVLTGRMDKTANALLDHQKAMIPANGTKGKSKSPISQAERKATETNMEAIVAAVMAAMQAK